VAPLAVWVLVRRECGVRTFLVDFGFIFRKLLKFVEGKQILVSN
jgi:hypothetical protein